MLRGELSSQEAGPVPSRPLAGLTWPRQHWENGWAQDPGGLGNLGDGVGAVQRHLQECVVGVPARWPGRSPASRGDAACGLCAGGPHPCEEKEAAQRKCRRSSPTNQARWSGAARAVFLEPDS